jgi:hypothetical protein
VRIVKQYKPCRGGTIFSTYFKGKVSEFKTLQQAQEHAEANYVNSLCEANRRELD